MTQTAFNFEAPAQRHSPTSCAAAASITDQLPRLRRVAVITTTKGEEILIDEEDLPLVQGFGWYVWTNPNKPRYAVAKIGGKQIRMHRILMNPSGKEQFVDHVNGNGLDNRRENLRLCSRGQNARNARKRRDGLSSKFRGVCWHKAANGFAAQIQHNGRHSHLGVFKTQERAAAEYDLAAIEMHGEFARLNFPDGLPPEVYIEVREELARMGLIVQAGTRLTPSGRSAVVWQARP